MVRVRVILTLTLTCGQSKPGRTSQLSVRSERTVRWLEGGGGSRGAPAAAHGAPAEG